MSKFVADVVILKGHSQSQLSLSTTGAQTAKLTEGVYDVWCDKDCYIKVGTTADDVTPSTGYLLRANNTVPIAIEKDDRIGGIMTSSTATLCIHRVGYRIGY